MNGHSTYALLVPDAPCQVVTARVVGRTRRRFDNTTIQATVPGVGAMSVGAYYLPYAVAHMAESIERLTGRPTRVDLAPRVVHGRRHYARVRAYEVWRLDTRATPWYAVWRAVRAVGCDDGAIDPGAVEDALRRQLGTMRRAMRRAMRAPARYDWLPRRRPAARAGAGR